jgi:hypothetical protein
VDAEQSHGFCETVVVREHDPAVAVAGEVFHRTQAHRRDAAEARRALALIDRALRLRSVLDDRNIFFRREPDERVHVAGQPEHVDGEDRARPRTDRRPDRTEIGAIVAGGFVDQHRLRADAEDRLDDRRGGVRREDHLVAVALPDAERAQREKDRVRARSDADRVLHAAKLRELALESAEVRAVQEPHRRERLVPARAQLGLDLTVFPGEIE